MAHLQTLALFKLTPRLREQFVKRNISQEKRVLQISSYD